MSEVFRYIIAREESGHLITWMFMNREILKGDLEDACNDLDYVRGATREDGWEIFKVSLEKI